MGANHGLNREVAFDPLPPRGPEFVPQRGIVEESHARIGKGLGIPRGHEKARNFVGHSFLVAADPSCDHRLAASHRFKEHIRKSFCFRGTDIDVESGKYTFGEGRAVEHVYFVAQ